MKAGWWEAPLTLRDLAEAIGIFIFFVSIGLVPAQVKTLRHRIRERSIRENKLIQFSKKGLSALIEGHTFNTFNSVS